MAKRRVESPQAGAEAGMESDIARAAAEVNEASSFGAALKPVATPRGAHCWRVVKVRRLTPDENRGRHNIYVRVLDETGTRVRDDRLRVRWTWEGRTPDQDARPPALDKGDTDFGHADIPLEKHVHAEVWIEGDELDSDHVVNLHTDHNISEKASDGSDGNTWFHHSFLVIFQRLPVQVVSLPKPAPKPDEKPAPKPIEPTPANPAPVQPPEPVPAPASRKGNRLGFYLQSTDNGNGLWDAIATVQPPVLLLHHDAVNDILLSETRAFRAPNTFVVGRWYLTNDEQRAMLEAGDPEGQGRALADRILNHDFQKFRKRTGDGRLYIDAWMSLNECLPGPASSSYREDPPRFHALYTAYDHFQVAFRQHLAQEKIEAVAFNFAAGNFIDGATFLQFFPHTVASHRWLGFHEYGWPSMDPAVGQSAAGTYRKIMQGIQAVYGERHRVIITEAGVTRAYGTTFRDEGWLNGDDSLSEDAYWASLAWYNEHLCADDYVLGAALFQVGHGGDWATFRHLGTDNQNKPIRLIERIRSLRDGDGERELPPVGDGIAVPTHKLKGRVTHKGMAVQDALVRLIGSEVQLGGVRGAVIDAPGNVDWTRRVSGYEGTLYHGWQRFVADQVAGVSQSGFVAQMRAHYGEIARLEGDQSYLLPQTASHPEIAWERAVTGQGGTLRSLWLDWVRGKVVGLDYHGFKRLAPIYNPSLVGHTGALDPNQTYLLPRTVGASTFVLEAITGASGRFRFMDVQAGEYEIEVRREGYRTLRRKITLPHDGGITLPLELVVDPDMDFESPGAGQGAFVGVIGNEFVVNGQVLRFIGVNLRGLVYYGAGKPLEHSSENHRPEMLGAARDMGVRVVRVFLPCVDVSTERTIALLRQTLDIVGAHNCYVIPALVDFYSTTPFRIPGDDGFYEQLDPNFSPKLLNGAFYRGGWRERYLPFVQAVVSAFRDDPRIFAWEVGNELKYEPAWADPERGAFIGFMHSVARLIRQIDPNHLVTTGMISTWHASLNEGDLWRRLYGTDDFDFLTVHCYNEQYEGKVDWEYARTLNKPFIVEEAGFGHEKPGDRVDLTRRDMEYWFGRGARGYMQWGFMPVFGDIGDGDDDSGMDRKFHGHDFDGLFALYRQRADSLAAESAAAPRPVPSRPAPKPTPAPEPTPLPATLSSFSAGQTVFALAPLRVRQSPGYVGKPESDTVVVLTPGQTLKVVGGPIEQDGLRWWQVNTGAQGGWAAQANGDTLLLGTDAPAMEMIEGMELSGMEVQG